MDLYKKLLKRIDNDFGYDNEKLAKDLETIANEYQALQLQQTGVMPCFSYGQIITDGVYDAKVIENTQIIHSTMVKYLHNNIFDNISGVGWKIK